MAIRHDHKRTRDECPTMSFFSTLHDLAQLIEPAAEAAPAKS
jgi:hypothetical protein